MSKAETIDDQDTPSTPPPGMTLAAMTELGNAIAAGMNQHQPKRVTVGQYLKKAHSPFHPSGPAKTLARVCYDNGVRMQADTLHDKEIDLLNRITHSGRYFHRKVEVIVTDDGGDQTVSIRYPCATPDQRFEMKDEFRNFIECLEGIVLAQEEEDEDMRLQEEETRVNRERRKRTFGQGKKTQDAVSASSK